jgi:uncharacterized membrane protein YadS
MVLATARSVGIFPPMLAESFREVGHWLTIVAIAAMGLEVQLQAVRRIGTTVALTVMLSWLVLLSTALMRSFGIGE